MSDELQYFFISVSLFLYLMNISKAIYKLTHWETWHHHVKYIPLAPVWLWYCIKARSLWFFTTSNPSLTFGGFDGEGKDEMYKQLPDGSYPSTIYITAGSSFENLKKDITANGFTFPFAVKPNVGMMGFMFRKISSFHELEMYHAAIPVDYVLQDLIEYPLEVSVFYYRLPHKKKGTISGFLMKQPPEVIGDGKSNLEELIGRNPALKFKQEEMKERHKNRLDLVLKEGEQFYLSNASNRSQGGKLENLNNEIDEQLLAQFDAISLHTKYFYYGRYDIKCKSIEGLKSGKDYTILEFNGAGAGIQHIYGNNLSLYMACKLILEHWKQLYRISELNHKSGMAFWGFNRGRVFLRKAKLHLELLKKLDASFPNF